MRGFASVSRFRGRDTRSEFWPYAAAAMTLYLMVGLSVGIFLWLPTWVFSSDLDRGTFFNAASQFILFSLLLFAALVVLLAAAVARRLHDGGLSALWGLLPLPFVAGGFATFLCLLSQFGAGRFDPALFFLGFVNNLLYLVAIAWLIVLLARRSMSGPNRFD
jgi:uncharacterized membrane protein YhaH (DUF805 family)